MIAWLVHRIHCFAIASARRTVTALDAELHGLLLDYPPDSPQPERAVLIELAIAANRLGHTIIAVCDRWQPRAVRPGVVRIIPLTNGGLVTRAAVPHDTPYERTFR